MISNDFYYHFREGEKVLLRPHRIETAIRDYNDGPVLTVVSSIPGGQWWCKWNIHEKEYMEAFHGQDLVRVED